MNGKHRWIALGAVAVCIAVGATIVLWPDAEPVAMPLPATPSQNAPLRPPSAGFDSATLLTATPPNIAIPLEDTALAPQTDHAALGLASEGPPISFMPERLELAQDGPWNNGWNEPVTGPEESILAHLPDWSAAVEWLVPSKPIAEVVDTQPTSYPDLPETPTLETPIPAKHEPAGRIAADASHEQYVVQPSDTLWTISQRTYGTGAFFVALAEHNRSVVANPHLLEVGQSLITPPAIWLAKNYPQLCPPPSKTIASTTANPTTGVRPPQHVVRDGDTLDTISVISLGRSDRWREILALNQNVLGASGGHLKPGMMLRLPPDARAATTVLRPADLPR